MLIPGFWSVLGGVIHQRVLSPMSLSPPATQQHMSINTQKNSCSSKGDIVSSHLQTVPLPQLFKVSDMSCGSQPGKLLGCSL